MKIWILLYIAGKLIMIWGPLPVYRTYEQCVAAMTNDNIISVRRDAVLICYKADTPPSFDSNINDLNKDGL